MQLPPCGLYKTRAPIAGIPAGRLVYFHNHGNPGPGVYLPSGWKKNRVQLQPSGTTVEDPALIAQLEPLPPEGFYRVTEPFHCCERRCRLFDTDMLVELGYDGEAHAILFTPELVEGMLAVPSSGARVEPASFTKLKLLKVPSASASPSSSSEPSQAPPTGLVH